MKNPALPLICLLLFLFSFLYLWEASCDKLSDTIFLAGDSVDYQSLAVNLVLGHGYKIGGVDKFETYKIDRTSGNYKTDKTYDGFIARAGFHFYRTPGYPLFLAFIYKLFGIHPRIVQIIQIILLAISVSLLPVIGGYYWSKPGIIAGIFSSLISLKYFLPAPSKIMAEPLSTFTLFVLVIFLMLWETKRSVARTFLLAITCSICVFVRGITFFLPVFLFIYIIFILRKSTEKFKLPIVFVLGVLLCVLPWSLYATKNHGSLVLISTQPEISLLDSNNEDSLKTGRWEPTWRKKKQNDPKYLYNRLKNSGYPRLKKLSIFIRQNKNAVPGLLKNKIWAGFFTDGEGRFRTKYLPSIAGMLLYYLIVIFAVKRKSNIIKKIPIFPLIYFLNILFITLIFYGYPCYTVTFIPFFVLPAIYLLFVIPKILMHSKI